ELDVAHSNLEDARKGTQHAEAALGNLPRMLQAAQLEKERPQRRNEHFGQASVLRRLQEDRLKSFTLGQLGDTIQENSLSNATQTEQHLTLGWAAALDSSEGDVGVVSDLVSAGELGWLCSSTWRKGIPLRVHTNLAKYDKFILRGNKSGLDSSDGERPADFPPTIVSTRARDLSRERGLQRSRHTTSIL